LRTGGPGRPRLARQSCPAAQGILNYGFPESHALSFAVLVYASAWIKHYYPAAFCAALLRAQPMGFYSPQSLVADAVAAASASAASTST
jgi:DNA polymerase III alpha subunit